MENLLSSKPAEFNLRWINKLSDKWQEVIKIMAKYTIDTIDWNYFFNKLLMNELAFTKTKLNYDNPIFLLHPIYIYIYIYI